MRFYTVPTAKEARKSVVWAIWLIAVFSLFTLVLGYGAAALVGPEAIAAAPGGVNSAAPLPAFELGGEILLGVISAIAFAIGPEGAVRRREVRRDGGPLPHGRRRREGHGHPLTL
jgi:Na+(H+)/acetate symporter ActP